MLKDLILKNRSYRRFDGAHQISRETLTGLVELARFSASGGNIQPLKYILSHEPEQNALIYDCCAWAGYLKDWPGPDATERPTGYIVLLGDTEVSQNFGCDHGIAAQSMLLGAVEQGLGGCMIGSINRKKLREKLALPDRFEILLIVALGKPIEPIVLDDVKDKNIKYWREADGTHHVPKRTLSELIIS
jgi:nitroreductase